MAVGLSKPAALLPVEGVQLATVDAGLRYADRQDVVLLTFCEGTNTAAVYTQNKFCAAPVIIAKQHQQQAAVRALIINSGNANAGTGQQGIDNAVAICQLLSEQLSIDANQILPFSTGVIGEQLPMPVFTKGLQLLNGGLAVDNWLNAAEAIMTTDTIAKGCSEQFEIDGKTVTITGIAKGSGMICPNMATMLSFVATDAEIDSALLQRLLNKGVNASFNRISVDSDTSTNDALVLSATGKSGVKIDNEQAQAAFYQALEKILITLATSIVRDGEGATKFVKVEVIGGAQTQDCENIAYSIAHSPLVKTALFASDPNWGRILAAVGKAQVSQLEIERVSIYINQQAIVEAGEPAASYNEALGQKIFAEPEIEITADLGLGQSEYHVWTSDLSHDYVSINADYRS